MDLIYVKRVVQTLSAFSLLVLTTGFSCTRRGEPVVKTYDLDSCPSKAFLWPLEFKYKEVEAQLSCWDGCSRSDEVSYSIKSPRHLRFASLKFKIKVKEDSDIKSKCSLVTSLVPLFDGNVDPKETPISQSMGYKKKLNFLRLVPKAIDEIFKR